MLPRLAARYAEGLSLAAVAREFGTTPYWVRVAVETTGGTLRPASVRTRSGRPFDLARARELYEQHGWTIRRIAEELGESRCRVHTHLRRAGVRMRDASAPRASRISREKRAAILAAYEAGLAIRQICRELHTSAATVNRVLHEAGVQRRPVRRLDRERMAELRAQGWSYPRIARELGTRPQYVWNVLNARRRRAAGAGS